MLSIVKKRLTLLSVCYMIVTTNKEISVGEVTTGIGIFDMLKHSIGPGDCCREIVETRLVGQQAVSRRHNLMQLICPVILKLERCIL